MNNWTFTLLDYFLRDLSHQNWSQEIIPPLPPLIPPSDFDKSSTLYGFLSSKGSDSIEGFGYPRYSKKMPLGGIVGDNIGVNYESYEVVSKINSIDGSVSFNNELDKFTQVDIDIINPSVKNTGLPHSVVEDTFEWINSGTPSGLSQVLHCNIVNLGLFFERNNPNGLLNSVGPYQATYIAPCDASFYDNANSTIDYISIKDNGNEGLYLPYPNCVIWLEERSEIWVGGLGGIVSIDIDSKKVSEVVIDNNRSLNIKDIKKYYNLLYILDEQNLYIYDTLSSSITKDNGLGLPETLNKVCVMPNSNIVVSAKDGIYCRKPNQDCWQKALESSSIGVIISPDAAIAVSDDLKAWYSTEGFSWKEIGSFSNTLIINCLNKYRSQIFIGTSAGLYQDYGSLYSGSTSSGLVDVFDNVSQSSNIFVNDMISNQSMAVIGLSDGRYIEYSDSFSVNSDSGLSTIHKVVIANDETWLFGYDNFRCLSENIVRQLSTGQSIL